MATKLQVRWQLLGEAKDHTTEVALWQEQFVLCGQMFLQFCQPNHTLAAVSTGTCLNLSALSQGNSISM